MAYLVRRDNGSWEIRESRQTENGPRSRTLATFRRLSPAVIERAVERSDRGLMETELIAKLDEAGIPMPATAADRAARDLLAELASGFRPSESLRRALIEELRSLPDSGSTGAETPETAGASGEQGGPAERLRALGARHRSSVEEQGGARDPGRILEDLLGLAEALPYSPEPGISQVPLRDLLPADGKPVDVFLNNLDLHQEVARRVSTVEFAGREIPVIDCVALTVFKAYFDRGKDWVDIEGIAARDAAVVERAAATVGALSGHEDRRRGRLLRIADRHR